ncbi:MULTISPECIES: hypothetical protein [unclassified Bradyrhizobium]|uniref:hypothetical protein n=1 Tax=unclassified Bradyrhizobium TaxID=2631580 RepID=UPI001045DE86|nr:MULTISPECIES: hypothetical protein [unclassified Bradyrhizobium]
MARFLDGALSREVLGKSRETDRLFEEARTSNLQTIKIGLKESLSEIIGDHEALDLPVTLVAAKRLKDSVEARDSPYFQQYHLDLEKRIGPAGLKRRRNGRAI